MAAAYLSSVDGHTLVYFGADRYATNGDSNIGFWFTQHFSTRLSETEKADLIEYLKSL